MLLLPFADHPLAGPVLAFSSALAQNLLIVGSIAKVIVVTGASRLGVRLDFLTHALAELPITDVTLAIAAGWLALRAN
jgi:Na+/H+ antiporter NhaD/arsenite permease-like protein